MIFTICCRLSPSVCLLSFRLSPIACRPASRVALAAGTAAVKLGEAAKKINIYVHRIHEKQQQQNFQSGNKNQQSQRDSQGERERGKQCLGDWQKVFQAAEQVKHNKHSASAGHA